MFEIYCFIHKKNFVRISVIFVNVTHCVLLGMHRKIRILKYYLRRD